jgi:GNAT superfamily N-acetyltransferase
MKIKHDLFKITKYNDDTKNGLFQLYHAVSCQRTGIARLPCEITNEYIENIFDATNKSGIGFSAFNMNGLLIGDIHAEKPNIYIFRNVLWNLTIAVHPDYQGNGIGRRLFNELINAAIARGDINRIELFCKAGNLNGLKLYKDLGFEIEGRLRNRINLDGCPEDDLIMGLLINKVIMAQQVDAPQRFATHDL